MTDAKHFGKPDFHRSVCEAADRLAHYAGLVAEFLTAPIRAVDDALLEAEDDPTEKTYERYCNGICITAGELGLPYPGVAYAHPDCDLHGETS